MIFPILLLRFPSNKSARCRDKAIVAHSLRVQEGQIQRPEHAAGRLEWHAIRQGHIPEIDELRRKYVSVPRALWMEGVTDLCNGPHFPIREQGWFVHVSIPPLDMPEVAALH